MFQIINAKFVTSTPNLKLAPPATLSEVVFAGRSNVGKSTLLNMLTNKKNLAKSSSTPGKTKLINFFEIEAKKDKEKYRLFFVDLPGFGYAKVSKKEKKEWETNLTNYLLKRDSIRVFIQLIDSRHPELENDKFVSSYLTSIKRKDQTIIKVFTKIDKLKQSDLSKLKAKNKDQIFTSCAKKRGVSELLNKICGFLYYRTKVYVLQIFLVLFFVYLL